MPLVKSTSKEAFRKNVKAEVNAGKPVKQAVAIAYSVKREVAAKKGKKRDQTSGRRSSFRRLARGCRWLFLRTRRVVRMRLMT